MVVARRLQAMCEVTLKDIMAVGIGTHKLPYPRLTHSHYLGRYMQAYK